MALSEKAQKALKVAIANNEESAEVIAELQKIAAAGAVDPVASADADGTYGAEEATLINELKAQVNALIAALS